jgi:uncharacterized protein YjbI with pentapeptide repeats
MKIYRQLLFTICMIYFSLGQTGYGQDIIFKNPENRVVMDYLDTTLSVTNQALAINIGPEHKLNQNTIFFNKPFTLRKDHLRYFRIKGSFLQHMTIDSSIFNQDDFYIDSTDFDTLFITGSTFKGSVVFRNVHIRDFHFSKNDFPGNLIFIDCEIPNISIEYSKVKGGVDFINCTLGNLNFEGSFFEKGVSLSKNMIEGKINFDACTFFENLNLSELRTKAETRMSFISTVLPDTFDFSGNAILPDTVNLASVSTLPVFNRKCRILLDGTDISKLRINYNLYKLIFSKELTIDQRENIYEGLLQNLKTHSYQQSYEALDIEYRRFHAKQGTFGFLWWVPEYWWQYGYDRLNVFKIVFWSVLILTLLNYIFLNYMVSKIYSIEKMPVYYRKWSWSRLWFSFVYTCIIFFSLSLKIDNINFKQKRGSVYLMMIYVFGIICLAYMANYLIQR